MVRVWGKSVSVRNGENSEIRIQGPTGTLSSQGFNALVLVVLSFKFQKGTFEYHGRFHFFLKTQKSLAKKAWDTFERLSINSILW
ncbi:hypothetical protein SUGI_0747670 [Cryptomeria japonica]|nr:hypothetical protein SUGI_0747670 [Cryptomeria japonica]